jgi:hypothetical protein
VRDRRGDETRAPVDASPLPCVSCDGYLHVQGEGRGPDEYLLYAKKVREGMMSLPGVHNWWVRCLKIDELNRQTGDVVAASQLARHASVANTQVYLHPTQEDLIARLKQVEW